MPDDFRVATPRVAAGVLFRDDDGRVLLVKPTYKDGWDIPGGYVEPGESPKQAAVREVEEELGLKPKIGRLLVVDWAPHPAEGDKILFVFDGGRLDASTVKLEAGELERAEYVSLALAIDLLPARLHNRIASATTPTGDLYLEGGIRTD